MPENRAGGFRTQEAGEGRGFVVGGGGFEQDVCLIDGRVQGRINFDPECAFLACPCGQFLGEKCRFVDKADGGGAQGVLQGLGDGLGGDHLGFDFFPQTNFDQGFFGCPAVGRDVRIDQGELPDGRVIQDGQPARQIAGYGRKQVDLMADMHQYFWGKTVALNGDPDQLVALTELLLSLDMKVKYVVTGTPGKKFEQQMTELTKELDYSVTFKAPGDLLHLHQWIKNDPVDLLIGTTHAKMIAHDEDIPFVRYGFPILDRQGHNYFPSLGYTGAIRILEKILDALMDRQERDAPAHKFELIL